MNYNDTTTKSLAEVGEDIGISEGTEMIASFRIANPQATTGYFIGSEILKQILLQPGCVGINFRKGLNASNEEHLVYTGVDVDGRDILNILAVEHNGQLVQKNGIVANRSSTTIDVDSDTLEEIIRKIIGR